MDKRVKIIKILSDCTEEQQLVFKRMYSHKNLGLSINEIVNLMDEDSLDRALDQCVRTMDKNYKNLEWLREYKLNKLL